MKNTFFCEFIIVILVLCATFFLGGIAGSYSTEKKYQKEAIMNNFAHYEMDIDKNITFHWNTNR